MKLTNYKDMKSKGLISVSKTGKDLSISKRRFNPDTGAAIKPEVAPIKIDALEKQKQELAELIENMDALIQDLKNL